LLIEALQPQLDGISKPQMDEDVVPKYIAAIRPDLIGDLERVD
jgi:hypothetical protein